MKDEQQLEGTALRIYWYIVKARKPTGPHEIMREANVGSIGLTYNYLQRLQDLGLLQTNSYGSFILKRKIKITSYQWIGNYLVPRALLYLTSFIVALLVEIVIFLIHYSLETYEFKVFFVLLLSVTALALLLFLIETLSVVIKMREKMEKL